MAPKTPDSWRPVADDHTRCGRAAFPQRPAGYAQGESAVPAHVRQRHPPCGEVDCFDAATASPFVSWVPASAAIQLDDQDIVTSSARAATAARTDHPTDSTFAALGVRPELTASLAARGIEAPFPIQAATLPDSLAGRDVLGRGRTGSGKTVAFALPLVSALAGSRSQARRPRGLVLVPTRELAVQVEETIAPLAAAVGLRTRTIFGGVSQGPQVTALAKGADIIVATPGRLADLIKQGHANLGAIAVTVIDEADHMADLGFLPEVRRLLDQTPAKGQRLLFSATLDAGVDVLARRYLREPVTHEVDSAASHVPQMQHHLFLVDTADRSDVVAHLLGGHGRSLAFARTKHQARKWARVLTASGIHAVDLHGNLSQSARQRNLAAFAAGDVRVLVATDIAARGIHVDDVGIVVHIDPPAEHKAYLHRSGRTARAGAEGVVVTLATPEQRRDVADLMRRAAIKPTKLQVRAGDAAITDLVGPSAPRVVVAAPAAQPAQLPGGGRGKPRPRKAGTRQGAPVGGSRTSSQHAGSPKRSGAAKPPRIARPATQQAPGAATKPSTPRRASRPAGSPHRAG